MLWAGGRRPRSAAEELVAELLARPEPARLVVGFTVLEQLGDDAVEVVRGTLDTPIGPHAWMFLAAVGVVDYEEVPPDLAVRAAIDTFLAVGSELGVPADAVELVLGGIPAEDQSRFIDGLATSDHPGTADVLELLGRHHPVKKLAKHARKAAHRWRSTHGSPRIVGPSSSASL